MKLGVSNTVQNGLDAYHKYMDSVKNQHILNVVTMDLDMPIMDGKKAAAKIREFEIKRGIEPCLLIVISGNCSESEIAECMSRNGKIRANAFLKKPASFEELGKVISNHFRPNNKSLFAQRGNTL